MPGSQFNFLETWSLLLHYLWYCKLHCSFNPGLYFLFSDSPNCIVKFQDKKSDDVRGELANMIEREWSWKWEGNTKVLYKQNAFDKEGDSKRCQKLLQSQKKLQTQIWMYVCEEERRENCKRSIWTERKIWRRLCSYKSTYLRCWNE